ncbi:K(+)/H(+) antiporter [Phlyctochytrium bullatum]|nr:K(+)/H(+) antiporter [Phlyctochytrium bullatum]
MVESASSNSAAGHVHDTTFGFIATTHAFGSDGVARLFMQIFIILCVCRLISVPFKFLRQPAVIAEVIGGILMGPSALGRWKWFMSNFFPPESLPTLNVLANFGLLMFLLLMGLELDLSVVAKRARVSLTISLTGILLTFTLSIGIADNVDYPKLLLFIGVACSVTAFPVLARILTERKLLKTPVGVTVISAAAVDDATGWMALALVIALIQATSPLTGLYIFLTVIAFAAFMFLLVRPALGRLHRYLLALRNQNANRDDVSLSPLMVIISFMVVFAASFFTSAVGIHAIFGAFITGLILPREDGFAVKLTEKLEEMITVVLLPLYFTYSGLKTNIGAINTGISFAGFLLVLLVACTGKIGGCSLAAKFSGLNMREALAVGILMNTKGLVEIIILNIGLDAGLINDQVFAVMVLLAITTTCMTTPLITLVYPESYYTGSPDSKDRRACLAERFQADEPKSLLFCVPTTASVSSIMGMLNRFSPGAPSAQTAGTDATDIHAVRLRPISDRMSTLILAASEAGGASWAKDFAITALRTFGLLKGVDVTPHVVFAHSRDYAKEVAALAYSKECDTIVVPWRLVLPDGKLSDGKHQSTKHRSLPANVAAAIASEDGARHSNSIRGSSMATNGRTDILASLFGVQTAGTAAAAHAAQHPAIERSSSSSASTGPVSPLPRSGVLNAAEDAHAQPLASTTEGPEYELDGWVGEMASQLLRKARVKVAVLVDRTTANRDLIGDPLASGASSTSDGSSQTQPGSEATAAPGKTGKDADEIKQDDGHVVSTKTLTRQAKPTPPKEGPILVPFFGGPDDRAALQMALRLASSSNNRVSVLHIRALHRLPPGMQRPAVVEKADQADGVRSAPSRGNIGMLFRNANARSGEKPVEVERSASPSNDSHVPAGYFVDPVDVEDARLLSHALGTDLDKANVDTLVGHSKEPSLHSTEDAPQLQMDTAVTEPPAEIVPAADAEQLETTVPPPASSDASLVDLGLPLVRILTSASNGHDDADAVTSGSHQHDATAATAAPGHGAGAGAAAEGGPVTLGGVWKRPIVTITEVMAADPLGTCLEILRSERGLAGLCDDSRVGAASSDQVTKDEGGKRSRSASVAAVVARALVPAQQQPSLVVLGHFGPTWTGLLMGAGVPNEMLGHFYPAAAGGTDSHHKTQWTVTHMQTHNQDTVASLASLGKAFSGEKEAEKDGVVRTGGKDGSVEERALGPLGAAIVRGGIGMWDLLVVRKIRISPRLKEA